MKIFGRMRGWEDNKGTYLTVVRQWNAIICFWVGFGLFPSVPGHNFPRSEAVSSVPDGEPEYLWPALILIQQLVVPLPMSAEGPWEDDMSEFSGTATSFIQRTFLPLAVFVTNSDTSLILEIRVFALDGSIFISMFELHIIVRCSIHQWLGGHFCRSQWWCLMILPVKRWIWSEWVRPMCWTTISSSSE